MSSSSTKNVHLKGEKEKVPLRKITSKPSKAKYNAPLEGRKSLENVASTHRTNNLRNSLSSSKVPIRLESRTGGCSKSNSEVMINENSNKSKGNSKRKIIDHLNSRESHPRGEDKVNAHLSQRKPSKLRGNSEFQINITENISHPRHSISSSSKEGNEHMKCHGQGRTEPKKMLPSKNILKKFSQSDLHLNNPNIPSAKRKNNFDFGKITNQSQKQSNLKKVSFKTYSTNDLTKISKDSKGSFLSRNKMNKSQLVKHGLSDLEVKCGGHSTKKKPGKIIPGNSNEACSVGESNLIALQSTSEVLETGKKNVTENKTNMNELENNRKTNKESNFDNLITEDVPKVYEIKISNLKSPKTEENLISKTESLQTENKYYFESSSQRKEFEDEVNEKIKFVNEQFKKNINLPISITDASDKINQKRGECGDYEIVEDQIDSFSSLEICDTDYESNKSVDEIKFGNISSVKKFERKQLLEKEINEKLKNKLTIKFKENQCQRECLDIDFNKEDNIKLHETKNNEEKLIILNSASSNNIKLNKSPKISTDKIKVLTEFPSNLSSSVHFNNYRTNFGCDDYNTSQTDFKLTFTSPISTDEIGPTKFSRIPRLINSKSPIASGQPNESTTEKMANAILSVLSKQHATGKSEKYDFKTLFNKNACFDGSPFTSPGLKDLTKSPKLSKIPTSLRSKSGPDSPFSADIKNDTFRTRIKSNSPTKVVLDTSKMTCVQEKSSRDENFRENEQNNLNGRSFTIQEFDSLIKDERNIEQFINSDRIDEINLQFTQRKRKNNREENSRHDIDLFKSGENSMNYHNENDLTAFQFEKNGRTARLSVSARYLFYRHSKMIILLGLIFSFSLVLFIFMFAS